MSRKTGRFQFLNQKIRSGTEEEWIGQHDDGNNDDKQERSMLSKMTTMLSHIPEESKESSH